MMPVRIPLGVCFCLLLFLASSAYGGYKEDIGYFSLESALGPDLVTGNGVLATQVESPSSGHWMPNPTTGEFLNPNKVFFNESGDAGYSSHATSVGKYFYGNITSIASGICAISVYETNDWLQEGFLRLFYWGWQPETTSARIASHSWVSDGADANAEILRRMDWVVDTDEFMQVVALNNGSTKRKLLSGAYNVISVGRTDGGHPYGTASVDEIHTAGRTAPHVVVPLTATSYTTPVAAASVALLVEAGHKNPSLSTDPREFVTANRNGDDIYNAERSEVIKAALMAGADRFTHNTSAANIIDYRGLPDYRTANGLDKRFGAGQLNIFNSYRIIASGEQNSAESDAVGQGMVQFDGFDYEPSFGGLQDANPLSSYYVTADETHTLLAASLVWNLRIAGGTAYSFDATATRYNLDLVLYDITDDFVEVAASRSIQENTENLFIGLASGHEYLLQVQPGPDQADFLWDFALAWQVRTDSDGDMAPDEVDAFADNPDEWQDADDDGMGDGFERRIIDFNSADTCTALENVLPDDDFDWDTFTNQEEFDAKTDPTQYNLRCDLNGDCIVNTLDFALLRLAFGRPGGPADFNEDGIVNTLDFAILRLHFGATCP